MFNLCFVRMEPGGDVLQGMPFNIVDPIQHPPVANYRQALILLKALVDQYETYSAAHDRGEDYEGFLASEPKMVPTNSVGIMNLDSNPPVVIVFPESNFQNLPYKEIGLTLGTFDEHNNPVTTESEHNARVSKRYQDTDVDYNVDTLAERLRKQNKK